jgi:uncharacterized protein YhbP (UPF0306 family)
MNSSEIEKVIRDYLPQTVHLSLATTKDNTPWVCELHFAYDDDLNLYFRSLRSCRHSQEIAANPKVAGNIVTQHPADLAPKGAYFEGTAKQLEEGSELMAAFDCLKERLGIKDEALEEAKRADGHKFYKITVDTYYLFDVRDSKPGGKFELKWA